MWRSFKPDNGWLWKNHLILADFVHLKPILIDHVYLVKEMPKVMLFAPNLKATRMDMDLDLRLDRH